MHCRSLVFFLEKHWDKIRGNYSNKLCSNDFPVALNACIVRSTGTSCSKLGYLNFVQLFIGRIAKIAYNHSVASLVEFFSSRDIQLYSRYACKLNNLWHHSA